MFDFSCANFINMSSRETRLARRQIIGKNTKKIKIKKHYKLSRKPTTIKIGYGSKRKKRKKGKKRKKTKKLSSF